MATENKLSAFVLELIKRTKRGEITWEQSKTTAAMSMFDEPVVDLVYETEINEKLFRIYKYKAKSYNDEYDWAWTDRIRLEMMDEDGNTVYEFPYDYSQFDLYNAVREKTSGIDDIIDSLFK